MAIRHAVFVEEQRFFESTDRDAHDGSPSTIHVLGLSGRVAGGAVRLYELDQQGAGRVRGERREWGAGVWKGDRLAVLPEFRKKGLGGPLVRFAVASAGNLGGRLMLAHVQMPNVVFFERLGWRPEGEPVEYVGHIHQLMAIDLAPTPHWDGSGPNAAPPGPGGDRSGPDTATPRPGDR